VKMNFGRWPVRRQAFEQIARRIEIHLVAELEVLLRAAGDERGEMEYDVDVGCDERAGELRIGEIADERPANSESTDRPPGLPHPALARGRVRNRCSPPRR